MINKFKFFVIFISLLVTFYCGYEMINYFSSTLIEKWDMQQELKADLQVSPADYTKMLEKLEEEKSSLIEQINRQTESISMAESTMAFLMKEDILTKISNAVKDTGASFDNFYVTFEGSIKNDYSVQVKGNIYQINQFIENLFIDTAGISIGEFSIRENENADFLTRYFDKSNALIWYDGTIYKANNAEVSDLTEEETDEIQKIVNIKLPHADSIEYVITLTFRV